MQGMGNSVLIKSLGMRGLVTPHKGVENVALINGRSVSERVIGEERRRCQDRREEEIPIFSKYWLTGRRGSFRREEDRLIYDKLDRHSAKTLAIILTIIMLSILDAIFTLKLMNEGATELNPIMAYYLNLGPMVFFGVKYSLTCASVLLVFFNQHVYIFKNRVQMKVLYLVLIIPYALVVQWELYLLFSIHYR
jgi:hypothetical protein